MGCSPWGREESDTTERLPFHFSLSCIGEGNGNPLQCSCLENPRDGGAWWAAVYRVAQGRTRLKLLSSSNSRMQDNTVCIHSIGRYLQTGFQYVPVHACTSNESSSALSTVCFGFRHSVRCVAASHCGCNWHFAHKMNIVLYCPFGYMYIYVCIWLR